MRIGLDLDGTLINYNSNWLLPTAFNEDVLKALKKRRVKSVIIITNQGGMCLGIPNKPSPEIVSMRIEYAIERLNRSKIKVDHVYISAFHKNATIVQIKEGASAVNLSVPFTVFRDEIYRKPSPEMLKVAKLTEYWGDSKEDQEASISARVNFVEVKRFEYEYV